VSVADKGAVEVGPGRVVAWTATGEGPPLLLLNGYAATGADWDPEFLEALGARCRVICPDHIGLGGSILGEDEVVGGVEGMTGDAIALLDALGLERVAVAGWSMGGFIAQTLARSAPERVAALALMSTHTGGPDFIEPDPEVFAQLIDHSGTARQQATRLLRLLFPPDLAAEADERFGDSVAEGRAALPERVLFMEEEVLVDWHERPSPLPPVDPGIPTVVVQGGRDLVVPPGNAEVLARVHPGARIEILDGCAHAAMVQESTAVAAAILAVAAG
jgi:3-oxoadipate enol-lactonase